MRFHSPIYASALATISGIVTIRGQKNIPIASVMHYADTACSSLNVDSDYRGYYQNSDAKPGSPEANYTYFCDPNNLPSYASYGIRHFESCYVDNGGNWYAQPLGMCAVFVLGNETLSVKFFSIDPTTGTTHQVYSDMNCTGVPKTEKVTLMNNICQESMFGDMDSYQIMVSGAHYSVESVSTCTTPSPLLFFAGLALLFIAGH